MPRELNETVLSLYFTKVQGTTLKLDVPQPKAGLTAADVKTRMDAIVAVGGMFDIAAVKDAGITNRVVSDFDVESL
jgi:repressor of nif and glnA expression